MNRINQTLQQNKKLLSIYFTAGYPQLNDTVKIITSLQENGADMIEIGLPFSDPLADGPKIQSSNNQAIDNGLTTAVLFNQLQNIRDSIHIPLIIMGYLNPMLQFGIESFCQKCQEVGIDGLIRPDVPIDLYQKEYQSLVETYRLKNIFLITPQTSTQRIKQIDKLSDSFIYLVSTASITGSQQGFGDSEMAYFQRIANMHLQNPQIVGFGIKDHHTLQQAQTHQKGAIIGTAFINHLETEGIDKISDFFAFKN